MRLLSRAAMAGFGAAGARAVLAAVARSARAPALERSDHRGHTVSLAAGPALAAAASLTAAAGAAAERRPGLAGAALIAGIGSGAIGLYDDAAGERSWSIRPGRGRVVTLVAVPQPKPAKGFRGHLAALREGRVTGGLVKIAGVGPSGLAAAALLPPPARHGRRGLAGPAAAALLP